MMPSYTYPVVLTIGGSDSSGGAGIQADLKTFATLGVHGTSAITAVTAQNTTGVKNVFGLSPEAVSWQLEALAEDFEIKCAKTGMLYSAKTTSVVADWVRDWDISLVLDPVMEAEAGGRLLDPDAVEVLRKRLMPLASVVTPNIFEAEVLAGIKVNDEKTAKAAAERILELGAEAAIITGGHLKGADLLAKAGDVHIISGAIEKGGNHGVGCTYSAAITAYLAKGSALFDAAHDAKKFATTSILKSRNLGRGPSPVNQLGEVLEEANRYQTYVQMSEALEMLVSDPLFRHLIPEVGSNVGMAIDGATKLEDIAAVEGRLVKSGKRVHASGCVRFGASGHVARIILAAMSFDSKTRAAMNVKLSQDLLDVCSRMGLRIASFDRACEPSGSHTMSWGTCQAISDCGKVPDIIWDKGGPGKEPMVRILGSDAKKVADLALEMARQLHQI